MLTETTIDAELLTLIRSEQPDAYRRPPEYIPTPEQIRAGCRHIQRTWSRRERKARAGLVTLNAVDRHGWTVPEVRMLKGGGR